MRSPEFPYVKFVSSIATIHPIELTKEELTLPEESARQDWTKIRPAIFGSIFEGSCTSKQRHKHGMHFTSEVDIMKIVRPTISNYWDGKIEAANTIAELNSLQLELQNYRVLDPACGSGNFLYLAYQELKAIEKSLLDKIASRRRSATAKQQIQMSLVTPLQFYGIDINPFAVELAKVTLTIAKKVAIDKLELTERELPLDTLDQNIICDDALFTPWIEADAIIGNPPFLGGSRIRKELGNEYTEKVLSKFSDMKAQVDFSSYWFRICHDNIDVDGRAGLVATNSICQGKSKAESLDYITRNNGYIHEAVSSQKWSGEANVYVSIVNWCKREPLNYHLNDQLVKHINSGLSSEIDVANSVRLKANLNYSFIGVQPNSKNIYISENQAVDWINEDKKNKEVLKAFSSAKDLTNSILDRPNRWIIDFADMNLEDIINYKLPFDHVKIFVKPERIDNRERVLREKWWRFKRTNTAMRDALKSLNLYFNIPCHSKWFIFTPVSIDYLPGNSTAVVASNDYYILGILTSNLHRLWVKELSSTLKNDTRYTPKTCFETFPFPQSPSKKIVHQIRNKTTQLHEYRTQQMEQKQWGITQLYNEYFHEPASKLYKLHQELDKLVMKAYGFKAKDDILAKLLELNFELAAKEKQGEKVIGAESPYVRDVLDIVSKFQNIVEEVKELEDLSVEQQSQANNSKSLLNNKTKS